MRKHFIKITTLTLLAACAMFMGCNPQQEAAFSSALSALSSLQQNKSLGEQFARDVKSEVAPDDGSYITLLETYEDARNTYNRFIDRLGAAVTANDSKADLSTEYEETQRKVAAFLRLASQTLDPSLDQRGVPFQRAIEIPKTLPKALHDLPARSRNEIVTHVAQSARWRSWRDL